MQSPDTHNFITETDHGCAVTTIPAPTVRPLDVRTTVGETEAAAGRRQENPENGMNGQRVTAGTGRYDTGARQSGEEVRALRSQ